MSKKRFHIIATILDKRGRVLSVGYNSYTQTHPLQAKFAEMCGLPDKIYLHAEIQSIVRLKHPHKAHKIKVERYDNNGNPKLACPCCICMKAIEAVGIPNIEWTKESK